MTTEPTIVQPSVEGDPPKPGNGYRFGGGTRSKVRTSLSINHMLEMITLFQVGRT